MALSNTGFQTSVGVVPAPAVEGDFASANPRFTVDAGQGALVAGAAGVTIGRFAWASYQGIDNDGAPAVVNSFGAGAPTGFVHREMQGLITLFLTSNGYTVPAGKEITLFNGGDFWVKNNGTTAAIPGQKCYANNSTGAASFAAAGGTGTGSVTGSIGAQTTAFTGSISGNVLTVTAAGPQPIVAGGILSGTVGGSGVVAGTQVVGQLSGTVGGVGTYAISPPNQAVGSGTLTEVYGILNVSAVASGTLAVGDAVSGTGGGGVTAGTVIGQLGTGLGATGTYYVNNTQTVSSTTITLGQVTETKWYAMSAGLAGEIVKISDHALG